MNRSSSISLTLACLFTCLIGAGPATPAHAWVWTNTAELPGAVHIFSLIEGSDGALYAGTFPDGNVFRSADGGASWTNTASLPGAVGVYSLLDGSDGFLYAGTSPAGDVFRSDDWGATWTATADLAGAQYVYALMETGGGELYAGTWPDGSVFRSGDGGATWTNTSDLAGAENVLCLLEASDGAIYAGTGPADGDVFRTDNGGASWTNTADLTDALHVYSLLEASDGFIYAGTHTEGDVFRTDDGGLTWTNTADLEGAGIVHSLIEGSDGYIYAGVDYSTGGTPDGAVFRTHTGGSDWTITPELPGVFAVYVVIEGSDGHLYAATRPNGDVFRTSAPIESDLINDRIRAKSGSESCPDCVPALAIGYPSFTVGPGPDDDLFEDFITLENISGAGLQMPIRTVLKDLAPEAVRAVGTDGGGARPTTGYWSFDLATHDGTTSADGVLDPGEKITRFWSFTDEGGAAFSFWVDAYKTVARGEEDDTIGEFGFAHDAGPGEPGADPGALKLRLDDGTAEMFGGGTGGLFVLANRFPVAVPATLRSISFHTSGAAAGDTVDVVVYEDTGGRGDGPEPHMEVWRTTVVLGKGGVQDVATGGLPVNTAGTGDAVLYAAVADTASRSYSLGVDMTGPPAGEAFVSTDGGESFEPLATVPILHGNVMIRIDLEPAGTCFIDEVI